jgi:hypothetical protein
MMHIHLILLFFIGLAAFTTASTRAAEQIAHFADLDAVPALLINKGVRQELGVDKDQAARLDSLAQTFQIRLSKAYDELRVLSENQRGDKRSEVYSTLTDYLRSALTEVLKPEQVKRFYDILDKRWGTLAQPESTPIAGYVFNAVLIFGALTVGLGGAGGAVIALKKFAQKMHVKRRP